MNVVKADTARLLFVNRTCTECGIVLKDDRHSCYLHEDYDCPHCDGIKTLKTAEDDREDFYVDTYGNRI